MLTYLSVILFSLLFNYRTLENFYYWNFHTSHIVLHIVLPLNMQIPLNLLLSMGHFRYNRAVFIVQQFLKFENEMDTTKKVKW